MATTTTKPPTEISRRELWWVRFAAALRTALACTIVGCASFYGPEPIRRIPAPAPAFSYVTTILIVSDATLGDALRGCWHALYATIQVGIPSTLFLWFIGPDRFSSILAAAVVAAISFVVALPESTHLLAKRIAFGQIVIVCVGTVIHGAQTGVMQPIHAASSTALGAVASLLAMLLPFPRLAYFEVKRTSRLHGENTSERFTHLIKAFTAQNNTAAQDLMSEAKFLVKTGAKLLLSIKDKQEGMMWERPQIIFLKPNYIDPGKILQELEIPIKGMELALTSCPSFPVGMIDQELRDYLQLLKAQIGLKLEQAKCYYASFDATTAPETNREGMDKPLWTHKTIASTEDVPAFFFFYCLELLKNCWPIAPNTGCSIRDRSKTITEKSGDFKNKKQPMLERIWEDVLMLLPSSKSLIFALKCSLSLGCAVFLGLIYNRENGYWSGLTIAISFINKRQATFTVSNARAQGTAMGSIYGILCCFVFQEVANYRFLLLLPWIIFTSFLRHSRMYGDAGGISAVIGALLILGRRNYGPPSQFAIARITEASIGLICFIVVEILFQPARSATLAKTQLSKSLGALRDVIESMRLCPDQMDMPNSIVRDKQKKLKSHINELESFIGEAELEPNFWFFPFHGTCYRELLGSLSRMADLLLFVAYITEFLSPVLERFGVAWKEIQGQIDDDLKLFNGRVGTSLKCLEGVIMIKSLEMLQQELRRKNTSHDIEVGRSPNEVVSTSLAPNEEDIEQILSSFLQHANEIANNINTHNEEEEKLKSQMVLSLNALSFCISTVMKETTQIEKQVKELIKWENPIRNVDLYKISSELNALHKK